MELRLQVRLHGGDGEKGRGGVPDPGLPRTKSCAPQPPTHRARPKLAGPRLAPRPRGPHSAARGRPGRGNHLSSPAAGGVPGRAARSGLALPGPPSQTQSPLPTSGTARGALAPSAI